MSIQGPGWMEALYGTLRGALQLTGIVSIAPQTQDDPPPPGTVTDQTCQSFPNEGRFGWVEVGRLPQEQFNEPPPEIQPLPEAAVEMPTEKAIQLRTLEDFYASLTPDFTFVIAQEQGAVRLDLTKEPKVLLDQIFTIMSSDSWQLCQVWLSSSMKEAVEDCFLKAYEKTYKEPVNPSEWRFFMKILCEADGHPMRLYCFKWHPEKNWYFYCVMPVGKIEIEKSGWRTRKQTPLSS